MGYENFREPCALCRKVIPKRNMAKIVFEAGHTSVRYPKKLCFVCDNCLPDFLEYLEVPEPSPISEVEYRISRMCNKCHHNVSRFARYCQHCGTKIKGGNEK